MKIMSKKKITLLSHDFSNLKEKTVFDYISKADMRIVDKYMMPIDIGFNQQCFVDYNALFGLKDGMPMSKERKAIPKDLRNRCINFLSLLYYIDNEMPEEKEFANNLNKALFPNVQ